jgi:hypothetical protein
MLMEKFEREARRSEKQGFREKAAPILWITFFDHENEDEKCSPTLFVLDELLVESPANSISWILISILKHFPPISANDFLLNFPFCTGLRFFGFSAPGSSTTAQPVLASNAPSGC